MLVIAMLMIVMITTDIGIIPETVAEQGLHSLIGFARVTAKSWTPACARACWAPPPIPPQITTFTSF